VQILNATSPLVVRVSQQLKESLALRARENDRTLSQEVRRLLTTREHVEREEEVSHGK
jgi:hypothetical protein